MINITKEQYDNLYQIWKNGPNEPINRKHKSFKMFLLEQKILVDRWNRVTRLFAFNPDDFWWVLEQIKVEDFQISADVGWLWGAKLDTCEFLPKNHIMVCASDKDFENVDEKSVVFSEITFNPGFDILNMNVSLE